MNEQPFSLHTPMGSLAGEAGTIVGIVPHIFNIILCQLPYKDLTRVRQVSKSWLNEIKRDSVLWSRCFLEPTKGKECLVWDTVPAHHLDRSGCQQCQVRLKSVLPERGPSADIYCREIIATHPLLKDCGKLTHMGDSIWLAVDVEKLLGVDLNNAPIMCATQPPSQSISIYWMCEYQDHFSNTPLIVSSHFPPETQSEDGITIQKLVQILRNGPSTSEVVQSNIAHFDDHPDRENNDLYHKLQKMRMHFATCGAPARPDVKIKIHGCIAEEHYYVAAARAGRKGVFTWCSSQDYILASERPLRYVRREAEEGQ